MAQYVEGPYIVEDQPDGTRKVVGYSGQQATPQSNTLITKQANPVEQQGDVLKNQLTQVQIQKAIDELQKGDKPNLPTGYRMRADGTAELIPGVAAPGTGNKATAAQRTDAIQGFNDAAALRNIAKELRQRFEQGPGATQGVAAIQDFLPTASNRGFDSAAQRARGYVKRSLGFTGGEGNTVAESTALYDPYLPSSSDYDSSILDKIAALEELANLAEGKSVSVLGGRPDASGNVVPVGQQSPIKQQLATGETRREVDPVASGIIDRMIRQGKSAEEINAVLSPLGFNPVGPGDVAAAQDYLRKNPKYDKSFGRAERILPIENPTLNAALQTAPGTAAATYLNAGGFGVPQALNPQAFEALRDKNPMSAFAGDVGGIITATSGIGAVGNSLARSLAPNALTGGGRLGNAARAIAPDAVYGAGYGAVTEGDPLTGAATAAVGSGAGQLLGKGLQKGFQGVSDPAVQYLTERGIPLTIGQTLGNRGIAGRLANKAESVPVLGDMLARNRMDGLKAFEREALNDVVSPIGGRVTTGGTEGLEQAQGAVSQAYGDALSGVNVRPDAQFMTDAQTAMQAGAAVPKFGEDFTYMMNQEVGPVFGQTGQLSGPQLQSALQSLGKMRSGFAKNPDAMAGYAADATGQMDDALTGLVSRQSPDTMPAYNAAKGVFQRLAPFENARISGVNQEAITPAQLARAITSNTKNFGGRAAAARGDNLTDLIRYGQEVLPPTVPNSATADRGLAAFALPAALGGSAVGAEYFADNPGLTGTLAALAALSTKTGQNAAQKALTKRPKAIKRLGGIFGRRETQKGLAGMVTAPLLIED